MSSAVQTIPASVLIPIFRSPNGSKILLTVRTDLVEHHKGQISFPGGKKDPTDSSLLETALRETEEEVGIPRSEIKIVGELPPIPTVKTDYIVSTFIGIIDSDPKLQLNTHEIDSVLFVPIRHLLDPANSVLETYTLGGLQYKIKAYSFEGHRIWGATGRILQMFLENEKILGEL